MGEGVSRCSPVTRYDPRLKGRDGSRQMTILYADTGANSTATEIVRVRGGQSSGRSEFREVNVHGITVQEGLCSIKDEFEVIGVSSITLLGINT